VSPYMLARIPGLSTNNVPSFLKSVPGGRRLSRSRTASLGWTFDRARRSRQASLVGPHSGASEMRQAMKELPLVEDCGDGSQCRLVEWGGPARPDCSR
jgi:hypothetical protein